MTIKIKINKTTYSVEKIDTLDDATFDYTTYTLRKKNTVKTLVHNTTNDEFTLCGGSGMRITMTTPEPSNVSFI